MVWEGWKTSVGISPTPHGLWWHGCMHGRGKGKGMGNGVYGLMPLDMENASHSQLAMYAWCTKEINKGKG